MRRIALPPPVPPTSATLRRPVTFAAALTLAMAASVLLQAVFAALGPFLREELALSRAQLGTLTAAMYVTGSTLSPVAGRLVDRLGPVAPLVALFAIETGAGVAVAVAPGYAVLLVVALVGGCGVAIGNPVTNLLVARHTPGPRQGVITGVKQSGVQVALFLGGAALPPLAAAYGWRIAALAGLALPVAGAACSVVALPREDRSARRRGASGTRRRSPRTSKAARSGDALPGDTRWLTAYAAGMGVAISSMGAYLPLYGVERLGLPAAAAGLLAAAIGGVGVVARIAWGRAADRRARPPAGTLLLLAALAAASAALVWAAEVGGVGLAWAGAVLAGASGAAWNAVGMLAVIRGTPVAVAGRASGVVVLSFYGGFAVGPATFGVLVDAFGYPAGWLLVVASFAASGAVAARWRRVGTPAGLQVGP